MPGKILTLLMASLLAGALPLAAMADRGGRGEDDRIEAPREQDGDNKEQARRMSLHEAVQMVQRRYDARVVSTDTLNKGGRTLYRLKLLNKDGKVWTVTVDAASGSVGK